MSGHRLSARDYKRRPRNRLGVELRWREFGIGLALGCALALVVFVADRRAAMSLNDSVAAPPHPSSTARASGTTSAEPAVAVSDGGTSGAEGAGYDFYRMLPKFEVVVPEHEHGARLAPAARIEQPGVYFLQVGSYRDAAVAERIRSQLSKLNIDATVQRVAVDADVWHRVRVGPIRDLSLLNRLRQRLQADDLDSLVIRVED